MKRKQSHSSMNRTKDIAPDAVQGQLDVPYSIWLDGELEAVLQALEDDFDEDQFAGIGVFVP